MIVLKCTVCENPSLKPQPSATRSARQVKNVLSQLLQQIQPQVDALVKRHQLVVGTLLMDGSMVEQHDAIGCADGGEVVGNGNHGDPCGWFGQAI